MKKTPLLILIILVLSCSTNSFDKTSVFQTSDLPAGEHVKESGKKLINQPYGFTKIISDSGQINNTLVITVHGYDSRGYEWVTSLNQLAEIYNNTYFYRYDWEICPDILGQNLANSLALLIQSIPSLKNVIIFGHSYGGLVVTYLASSVEVKIPIEIHTIAAPLAGYPRLLENCKVINIINDRPTYPAWEDNISYTQWRTQKHTDGAYRDLDYDPQDIYFENGKIFLLPETMNGQRLGHNWSITWVINNYLNE